MADDIKDAPKYITADDFKALTQAFLTELKGSLVTKEDLTSQLESVKTKPKKEVEPDNDTILRELHKSVRDLTERDILKDKQLQEAKVRELALTNKNNFSKTLTESGFDPKYVDAIYKLQQADGNLVPDGDGGFNWKVEVNGIPAALPLKDAIKHFAKSELGLTFLPAKTDGGGTIPPKDTSKSSTDTTKGKKDLTVDWVSVINTMKSGSDEGSISQPRTPGDVAPRKQRIW